MNREWEHAEVLLNRAVDLYPDLLEARTDRARFYWGRGFLIQALEDYNEAKRIAPNDYWIAMDMGNLLMEMNRRSQALEEFNRAIEINPGEYLPYIFTAGLMDDLGDHDGALNHYTILARLNPQYYFGLEGLGLHQMRLGNWAEARNAFMEAYRRAPDEHLYALLAAINWMRVEGLESPRAFLQQVLARVQRNTLEWHMFRLFIDLTNRTFTGESDMAIRLDRETNEELKARMLFYKAQYYDLRGNTALANKHYLMVHEMNIRAIPEWRLNEWILAERDLNLF
jgi:tetratricopeptide (TPR) repeat protein